MGVSGDDADTLQKTILAGEIGLSIAVVTTVVRIAIRLWRRSRLAWDDAFAILSILLLVVNGVAGMFIYSPKKMNKIPQHSRVALYYVSAMTFDLVIWFARLSILATVMRLGYYTVHLRTAAGLFCLSIVILLAQVLWVCESQDKHNHWKSNPHPGPQCVLGREVVIAQVTTDAFADVILVCAPLMILRYLKSDEAKAERARLSVSFAVGGLTTLISIVHAYYLIKEDHTSLIISSVEMSVSVIICNLNVLTAALHRIWKGFHPSSQENEKSLDVSQSLNFGSAPAAGEESLRAL